MRLLAFVRVGSSFSTFLVRLTDIAGLQNNMHYTKLLLLTLMFIVYKNQQLNFYACNLGVGGKHIF